MAHRGVTQTPKLIKTLHAIVRQPSFVSAVFRFRKSPGPPPYGQRKETEKHRNVLDLTHSNKLFSSFSTSRLLRSTAVLQASAVGPLVDVGSKIMNSSLLKSPLLGNLILTSVKKTFFDHFCAGESHEEIHRTVERLQQSGLRSMLVYGVEDADDNPSCDRNLQAFLETVESATRLPDSSTSFIVVKITAICPIRLLERMSDLLRWEQRQRGSSFHLPWKMKTLPIFSDSSPLYHTQSMPPALSPGEEDELLLAHRRLLTLSDRCKTAEIPLVVDAEYTTVQPAIDYLTYSAAIDYNTGSYPIIFGTIQAYLKDAKERLMLTTKAAEKLGISMGYKLVRGAYMSSESKLANSLGFESPVHGSIQDTHDCFNGCASFMLDKIADGYGSVILATHNVESGRMAVTKAKDMGMARGNPRLQFAQLYGMSDALSFGLMKEGFLVSKYMPFGPVQKVVPYLLRRAEENRGVLATSSLDRSLMRQELQRRLKKMLLPGNGSTKVDDTLPLD